MNQSSRRRRRGSLAVAALGVGLLAQILVPQAAFAHDVTYGRCLGGFYGLTTGGQGWIRHNIYYNHVSGSVSAQNNCGALWGLPGGWVVDNNYVYGNGQFCASFSGYNPNGSATGGAFDERAWSFVCAGAPHPWLTADVQAYVWNPNNGGFWQGGWVGRPTIGHQF